MIGNHCKFVALQIGTFYIAHTMAKHSCSVTEYFLSGSANARLEKAITFSSSSIVWVRTAPKPTEITSAERMVPRSPDTIMSARSSSAPVSDRRREPAHPPHTQRFSFFKSRVNGSLRVANYGINLRYHEEITTLKATRREGLTRKPLKVYLIDFDEIVICCRAK